MSDSKGSKKPKKKPVKSRWSQPRGESVLKESGRAYEVGFAKGQIGMFLGGAPVPKGLIRTRFGVAPDAASREYMSLWRELAYKAASEYGQAGFGHWDQTHTFDVTVVATVRSTKKGDLDNIVKATLDGVQPWVVGNDVDVIDLRATKAAGDVLGCTVVITDICVLESDHGKEEGSESEPVIDAGVRLGSRPGSTEEQGRQSGGARAKAKPKPRAKRRPNTGH